MEQEGQVRHFLDCWAEEVAGRGVEWGWRRLQVRAGCAGWEVYLVARAAHDGREDRAGRVVAREAGLHQPGAVVAHQGGGLLVVAHLGEASVGLRMEESKAAYVQCLRGWPRPRPRRKGQGRWGSPGRGGGRGTLSSPFPSGQKKERGKKLQSRGEEPPRLPGQEAPPLPQCKRDGHPLAGPPRPFTFSPSHEPGSHFGPIHTPIHARAPAGGKSTRQRGPQKPHWGPRLPLHAPLSSEDRDPGQKKLEPNEKFGLKEKKSDGAAGARGTGFRRGAGGADSPSAGRARLGCSGGVAGAGAPRGARGFIAR